MLNLSSVMVGSAKAKALAEFYEKVIGRAADWTEGGWYGWQVGDTHLIVGEHSEVKGKAKEPQRVILNFETRTVKKDFARIKELGATVIKDLYELDGSRIGTFADPDGNYFQVASPWKG
jgi:predicted enzyme related to lactoylglutathione lyase